ncbi:hypothetical protein AAG598_07755 [Citromicrobium bathyomarinum]
MIALLILYLLGAAIVLFLSAPWDHYQASTWSAAIVIAIIWPLAAVLLILGMIVDLILVFRRRPR